MTFAHWPLKLHPVAVLLLRVANALNISIHPMATVGVSSTLTWTRDINDPMDIKLILLDPIRDFQATIIPNIPAEKQGTVAVLFSYPSNFLIRGVSASDISLILASTQVIVTSATVSSSDVARTNHLGTLSPGVELVSATTFTLAPLSTSTPTIPSSTSQDEKGPLHSTHIIKGKTITRSITTETETETETVNILSLSTDHASSFTFSSTSTTSTSTSTSLSQAAATTVSTLVITAAPTLVSNTGLYSSTQSLTTATSENSSDSSPNSHPLKNTAIIIGVVAGTLLFVIVVSFLIAGFLKCHRRRRRRGGAGKANRTRGSFVSPSVYQAIRHPDSLDQITARTQSTRSPGISGPSQSRTMSHPDPTMLEDGESYFEVPANTGNGRNGRRRGKRDGIYHLRDIWNDSSAVALEEMTLLQNLTDTTPPLSTARMNVKMVNPSSTSLSSSDAQPRSQRQKDGMRGVPSHTRIPVEDASDSGGYAGCEADERRYVPAEECIPSSSTLHPPGFHESQQSAVTSSPPTSYSAESPQDMLPLADAEVSTEMKAPHRDTISLDSIWAASEESGSSQELRRAIDEREAGWAMEGFLEPLTPNDQPSSYVVSGRAELGKFV